MAESQAGATTWDQVSKETFEMFAQFAYTGDYTIPTMEKRDHEGASGAKVGVSSGEVEQIDRPVLVEDAFPDEPVQSPLDRVPRKGRKKKMADASQAYGTVMSMSKANFQSLAFDGGTPRDHYRGRCEPDTEFFPDQSYSKVFVGHASLYLLGHLWMIDSLQSLALYKLHKTLCAFQLATDSMDDVLDLIRCAYSEEGEVSGSNGDVEGLRNLVCKYLVMEASFLSSNDGFMEILGEGGQFVKDFFRFEVMR